MVEKFTTNCPACHQSKLWANLQANQIVECMCGKQFDCVWYRPVSDVNTLGDYFAAAKDIKTAYDFETDGDEESGNDEYTHNLVGVSFCRHDQRGQAIYVPLRHAVGQNMAWEPFAELTAPFLQQNPMSVHSASYMEWPWTYVKFGVKANIVEDSVIAMFLQDPNRAWRTDPRTLKLKELAREVFDIDVVELKSLVDLKTSNFSYVPVAQAYAYGCQDSDLTVMLLDWCEKQQVKESQPIVWRMEHALIPVIGRMHLRGIKLDAEKLVVGAGQLDIKIEELEREVFTLMGFKVEPDANGYWERPFDLGSNQKVAEQLFHKMGIPYDQKSVGKNGYPSVAKEAIQDLQYDYPVIEKLMELKGEIHSRDNYVSALPAYVNAATGVIHGYFNQTGAPTGRFSHSQPNLANQAKIQD